MPESTTLIADAMPQPHNRIAAHEWRRLAQVLRARKDGYTYTQIADDMGAGMTRRKVNTRVNVLSKEHGTVSAMVARTKRGATETYRLTPRGVTVCAALSAGRPIPPRPVPQPAVLSRRERDWTAFRATLGLPEAMVE